MRDKPLGIRIFGVGNIMVGLFLFTLYSFYFLSAFELWIGDRKPYGAIEWFCSVFVDRLAIMVIFIFSFQLIRSGVALLIVDRRARKISKISSIVISCALSVSLLSIIVLDFVYPQKVQMGLNLWALIIPMFIFYTIYLFVYLNHASINKLFDDHDIKVSFIRPILIIIIVFLFPFISGLFLPRF